MTSTFNEHGLLGVTGIVATILGGVCNLAIAKVIDIWGRCEGFIVMIFLVIIGMVMKAACINIEMYAAANTIYWVGHIGVGYVITILFADMTTLRNRLILFGLKGTPIICSVFAGPKIADLFVHHSNFRWAFGAFCIIYVFFAIPVIVVFILTKRKGVREGKFPKKIKTRTYWESTKFYFVEFDGKCLATAQVSVSTHSNALQLSAWLAQLLAFACSCCPSAWLPRHPTAGRLDTLLP